VTPALGKLLSISDAMRTGSEPRKSQGLVSGLSAREIRIYIKSGYSFAMCTHFGIRARLPLGPS
jgi:hypothetical protein